VAAGEIVTAQAKKHNSFIVPVDSEHSAIFQSLQGERAEIEKILLTASGGPFLDASIEQMAAATKEIALKHPRWNMGAKVTIDSASMMNKGLEMIEARWLFDVEPSKIQMVIHPQSIIHSMVQFTDGSIIGQLGVPDMRIPIQYALSYPYRIPLNVERLDLFKVASLTFREPDMEKFPCIRIAYDSIKAGGNIPCIMNAANEIAVAAFLRDRIRFTEIPSVIEKTIGKCNFVAKPDIEDIFESDRQGRIFAEEFVNQI
jgi:1-deoxy-D-xylulose-5-phosphate reductoisomerase